MRAPLLHFTVLGSLLFLFLPSSRPVQDRVIRVTEGDIVVSGNANVTFYDDIANSGVINVANGSTAVFFGALTGNGAAGSGVVFLEGDTRPGFSPGVMNFGGDVNFGFFSSLATELGGLTPGTGYDQVAVAGGVTLNGTLDVTLINSFTPNLGDTFDIREFHALVLDGGPLPLTILEDQVKAYIASK